MKSLTYYVPKKFRSHVVYAAYEHEDGYRVEFDDYVFNTNNESHVCAEDNIADLRKSMKDLAFTEDVILSLRKSNPEDELAKFLEDDLKNSGSER